MWRIRQFWRNVYRVCYWLPVIWKDRWWDHCYLLQVLEHKLRYDAERYCKSGMSADAGRIAIQMLNAAELCRRLYTDNYSTPWDKEAAESGWRLMNYMRSNLAKEGDLVFHSSEGSQRDPDLERKASWAYERESEMRNQDLDFLTKLLRKQIFSWWD